MPYNSSPRRGARVRLLGIHSAEGARTVESLDRYFRARPAASSHAAADPWRLIDMVPYERAAWTMRNANPISDNLELCGFARWTRAEWLAVPGMLAGCARWLARRVEARDVPVRRLTLAQVRAGEPGIVAHNDWTRAMRDGTHWDPGPGFPWDTVLDAANSLVRGTTAPISTEGGRRMTPDQEHKLDQVLTLLENQAAILWGGGADMPDHGLSLAQSLAKDRFAFFTIDGRGGVFEAVLDEGTYRALSEEEYAERVRILDHWKINYSTMVGQAPVTVPAAYGREVV